MAIEHKEKQYSSKPRMNSSPKHKENAASKSKRQKHEKLQPTTFTELFRYSTVIDKCLMSCGLVSALIQGSAMPLLVLVFGRMTDDFVVYSSCNNSNNCSQHNESSANSSFYKNESQTVDYSTRSLEDVMTLFAYYYITVGCVALLCGFLQVHTMSLTSTRQIRKIRQHFFKSVIRQEMEWFDNHSFGELNSKLNEDVKKIGEAIGDKLAHFVNNISTVICALTIGFINGWQLTLIVLSTAPLIGGASVLMEKFISSWADIERQAYEKAGTIVENALRNIRTVVAYGAENTEVQRYYQKLGEAEKQGVRKGLVLGLFQGFLWFLLFSTYALAFWYGSVLALNPYVNFSIGKLIIVFFSFVLAAVNFGHASTTFDTFMIGKTAAAAVYQVIDKESAIDPMSEKGVSLTKFSAEIKFQNVEFHYFSRKQHEVLRQFNETFVPGKIYALEGPSGTGKSTVLKLVQRLYDPSAGVITLDGVNLKEFNVRGLRNIIGVVQQDPVLFATSISENIRLGSDSPDKCDVIAAAKEANAYDFIMKLPEKFDTMAGVGGCQLSGGQKQRIAIARALIRKPKILLLDQPCSALDTLSETVILQSLKKNSHSRTTILVAHRQSTIKISDFVVKMKTNFNDHSGNIMKVHSHLSMTVDNLWHINEKKKTEKQNSVTTPNNIETCANALSDSDYESTNAEDTKEIILTDRKEFRENCCDTSSETNTSECEIIFKQTEEKDDEMNIPPTSRILQMNISECPYIILGSIGALFNGAIQPLFAVLLSAIIGIYAMPDHTPKQSEINRYCIFMAGVAIVSFAAHFLQHYMFAKSGEKLTRKIRKDTFSAMLKQDISWFDRQATCPSLLSSRLSRDAGLIQGAAGVQIGVLVSILTSIVTALAIAFYSGWKLALVEIAFFPLIIGAYAIQGRMINANTMRHQKAIETADQLVSDALNSIETVAQFGHEEYFGRKYDNLLLETYKNGKKLSLTQAIAFGFATSVLYFSYAATFRYGAALINTEEIELENMFRVYFVIIFAGISLGKAYRYMPDYRKAKKSAGRVFAIMDRQPPMNTPNDPAISPDDFKGDIQLKECEFYYPARPNCLVLESLSVSITRGQTLALVGLSGCGKSTVVQLLERFYDAKSGLILFDGEDIRKYDISYLRSKIGVVFQEPVLFDGSIYDNIVYGCKIQPTTQEVHDAAKIANIHELIVALDEKYDTQVGYKGNRLSKGERQRIAIARSLVRKPTVLLLDEATSSLDGENEKLVQAALDRARKGRTSILIAHRLSTIQNADKIAVMSQGKIIECGSHEELLKKKGAYFNMIKINSMQA